MRFSMSSVFGGAFSILGKAFVPLLIVTVGLYLAPYLVLNGLLQVTTGINLATPQAWQGSLFPVTLVASLGMWFLMLMHISAVTEIAVLKSVDKAIDLKSVVLHAAGNALPLLGIYILCALGWFLTALLLLIPAFIFAVVFSVVVPAYVAEKPGFFGAFARSRDLTRGHRWGIFGMWLLIMIVFYLIIGAVEFPIMMPILKQSMEGAARGTPPVQPDLPLLSMVVITVVGNVLSVIMLVLNASFYAALRGEKEKYSGPSVEKVFE